MRGWPQGIDLNAERNSNVRLDVSHPIGPIIGPSPQGELTNKLVRLASLPKVALRIGHKCGLTSCAAATLHLKNFDTGQICARLLQDAIELRDSVNYPLLELCQRSMSFANGLHEIFVKLRVHPFITSVVSQLKELVTNSTKRVNILTAIGPPGVKISR